MNIAINGFGRIGRSFLRSIFLDLEAKKRLSVVVINLGPDSSENIDILFRYDSVMGMFPGTVTSTKDTLTIDGTIIQLISVLDPEKLPWNELQIQWVVESSGCFTKSKLSHKHIIAGASKVLITAPSIDAHVTIIPGVNQDAYDPILHNIVSLGSCTTNCFAPMIKIIHEMFGIDTGCMTTTHAYTNDQVLLDVAHKDPRRARAAGLNIIPTKTGVTKLISKLFPDLDGKIHAIALRVPIPVVSLIDFTFLAKKKLNKEEINEVFKKASLGRFSGIIQYEDKLLVSSDFIGHKASCIFDSTLTHVVGNIGKVFAWYDNEFGYVNRLKDFLTSQRDQLALD